MASAKKTQAKQLAAALASIVPSKQSFRKSPRVLRPRPRLGCLSYTDNWLGSKPQASSMLARHPEPSWDGRSGLWTGQSSAAALRPWTPKLGASEAYIFAPHEMAIAPSASRPVLLHDRTRGQAQAS
jgi:hypothetical protein